MKILVCESEEVLLTAIEFRLRKNGYKIEWAKSYEDVLEKIAHGQPDMFVIDIETEKMDSLELIKEIKEETNANLPILVMAEMESAERILDAIQLGVNDFLIKPFKPVELVLRVQIILDKIHS